MYAKGVRYERELLKILHSNGFSVCRAASSGGFLYPLDILAIKNGVILAFEIKRWKKEPKIDKSRLKLFAEWCERAGAIGFLAWRKKEWLFKRLDDDVWIKLPDLLKIF